MSDGNQILIKRQSKNISLTRAQFITINAVLFAIIILSLGFPLSFGPISLAALPLIVVIVATQVLGFKNGIITGAMFGTISFVGSFIAPSILSQAFINPLVSLFPRILIGVTVYFSNKFLIRIFNNSKRFLAYATSACIGVLTNTILVIGMILLFNFGRTMNFQESSLTIGWEWMTAILIENSIFELVICAILVPPITIALIAETKRRYQRRIKPALVDDQDSDGLETNEK
ncbi:MAG: ECF transporter S component [Christensenellaceae bacterium]|jgi:uncharacterized membrane protein|nr:ECF transporter S component [Christensenellaceae bacterium]